MNRMYERYAKPMKEGPVVPILGAIGGYAMGGTAMAALAGAAVGATLMGAMKQPKMPDFSSMQTPMPEQLPAPTMPSATQPEPLPLPGEGGAAAPPTTAAVAKGEMDAARRRGRLSTILSRRDPAGGEEMELLGGL